MKTLWVALHDLGVTFLALIAALALRGEPYEPALSPDARLVVAGGFSVFAVAVYWFFSLYAARWRFASLFDLFGIFKAVTFVSVVILIADYLISPRLFDGGKFLGGRTIIIYWCVQVILLGGPRVAYRAYRSWRRNRRPDSALGTLIIGQVSAADGLIRLWEAGLAGPLHIYGIITPSPEEVGQTLRGISVWGTTDQIELLVQDVAGQILGILSLPVDGLGALLVAQPETNPMVIGRDNIRNYGTEAATTEYGNSAGIGHWSIPCVLFSRRALPV